MLENYLEISEEVKHALNNNKPIVALESTIISHGMPYPQNVETALKVENIVIENHKEANVQIFEYTNKVPEFMSISSLVVTKPGGLTTSESLASGLPIVVINPIPGQEEENAEYLVNHNTAIWLKKDDNVEEIINNLLSDTSKLEEMSNNAKSISKPNSTNDICKILLNN